MPALLPFRALFHPNMVSNPFIYIPGEQAAPVFDPGQIQALLEGDTEPALFIYRQRYCFPGEQEESIREGIMGVLGDRSQVRGHEQVFQSGIDACCEEMHRAGAFISSLFLWCNDSERRIASLLHSGNSPRLEYTDQVGCRHQVWRMTDPDWISAVQCAIGAQPLFLADGHHRFAAGWELATVQIRASALQTFAAHRLVLEARTLRLPVTHPVNDLTSFWAGTPPGRVRFGVLLPELRGFELPCAMGERNVSVLHRQVLHDALVTPVRDIAEAADSVRKGIAQMAFLLEPLSLDAIEKDAIHGLLLPPKSTDFFPKLAAGLVMCRHQKLKVTPPTAQIPGVRNPSS
jgi:hypothetical protein